MNTYGIVNFYDSVLFLHPCLFRITLKEKYTEKAIIEKVLVHGAGGAICFRESKNCIEWRSEEDESNLYRSYLPTRFMKIFEANTDEEALCWFKLNY